MKCNTCGTSKAAVVSVYYDKELKSCVDSCDLCSKVSIDGNFFPDVFLGGKGGEQTDENLAWRSTGNPEIDARCEGKPIPYSTKREKALAMKLSGVRQADSAERQHGFRNESHLHRKTYFT